MRQSRSAFRSALSVALSVSVCSLLGAALARDALAQAAAPSDRIDVADRETEMVTLLTNEGDKFGSGRVVVHLPRGALPKREAEALAERLNKGLDALEAFTGSPHLWQRQPDRIDYFFHHDLSVSYARSEPNRVFVALERVREGGAPLLHETTHVILYPTASFIAATPALLDEQHEAPVWLSEGIATYVGKSVAVKLGVAEGDPMNVGSLEQLDARCAAALAAPAGAEFASYIGGVGAPAALGSRERRAQVGPGFYGCSASFTKFLTDTVGIEAVIDLLPAIDPPAALERLVGKPVDAIRADWRNAIGAPSR